MKKQTTILIILSIVILGTLVWKFLSVDSGVQQSVDVTQDENHDLIIDDPIDVVMELYDPWFASLKTINNEFSQTEILDVAPLTADLRAHIQQVLLSESVSTVDPILCQTELPERIGAKMVFTDSIQAQLVVVARGKKVSEQALVSLELVDSKWIINDITCSQGEIAPDLEFTFENDGYLLKQSLQPPLDAQKWHLIYTKDGVPGHTIPLMFDETSVCIEADSSEQMCVADQFLEATEVSIKGSMQEAGALVQRMELW